MKTVLIISPHFPPVNAPDMHRIRMALPYFKELGWEPVVICVHENFVEGVQDELLNETIPKDIEIYKVKAWPVRVTRRLGLGSLSMRSYIFFRKKGSELLRNRKFDLVYFSTTAFHVCRLGRYWKKKFGIPFIIDLQDPWRNDFYLNKPKALRPPKHWLTYQIHKKLEAETIPYVDGVISVSQGYIDALCDRYATVRHIPMKVISFGTSERDFEIIKEKDIAPQIIEIKSEKIQVVYIGAITPWFLPLVNAFFIAFKKSIKEREKYHFYFIGTSYAPGKAARKIVDLTGLSGIEHLVTEVTERIPYFAALATLINADILFIPGSTDRHYNASKVYNTILSKTPIFSIFNNGSLVKDIIEKTRAGVVVGVDGQEDEAKLVELIVQKMDLFRQLHLNKNMIKQEVLEPFTAKSKCQEQTDFFDLVLADRHNK